ncbi:hypothetical protein AAZX31_10G020400 [Glycine max]
MVLDCIDPVSMIRPSNFYCMVKAQQILVPSLQTWESICINFFQLVQVWKDGGHNHDS